MFFIIVSIVIFEGVVEYKKSIENASVKTRTVDEGMIDQKGNLNFSEYMAACSSNQYLTQRLAIEKKLNLAIDNKIVVEQQKRQLE